MKKSSVVFFKTLGISLVCCFVFIGVGFFYLNGKYEVAQNETPSVPYYPSRPENAGVLLMIGESKTLFYLNFEGMALSVVKADFADEKTEEIYGYSVDYKINGDYTLLAEIIDIAGGIELEADGERLNFTGVQVAELLSTSVEHEVLRQTVTEKTVKALSFSGLQKKDFLYIIENSETNLTVPDCYFWSDYITELCKGVVYVN